MRYKKNRESIAQGRTFKNELPPTPQRNHENHGTIYKEESKYVD